MEENGQKGQEKQVAAHAKRIKKIYEEVEYKPGDEVLLLNMKKRGRKDERLQPDFSGPYIIQDLCGNHVTLQNSDGETLNTTCNVDHIKPYLTPDSKDVALPQMQLDASRTHVRPTVIHFAKKTKSHVSVIQKSFSLQVPPETQRSPQLSTEDKGAVIKEICIQDVRSCCQFTEQQTAELFLCGVA